jgi:hypothetical protein
MASPQTEERKPHHPQISEYSKSLVRSEPIHERLFGLAAKRREENTQSRDGL